MASINAPTISDNDFPTTAAITFNLRCTSASSLTITALLSIRICLQHLTVVCNSLRRFTLRRLFRGLRLVVEPGAWGEPVLAVGVALLSAFHVKCPVIT